MGSIKYGQVGFGIGLCVGTMLMLAGSAYASTTKDSGTTLPSGPVQQSTSLPTLPTNGDAGALTVPTSSSSETEDSSSSTSSQTSVSHDVSSSTGAAGGSGSSGNTPSDNPPSGSGADLSGNQQVPETVASVTTPPSSNSANSNNASGNGNGGVSSSTAPQLDDLTTPPPASTPNEVNVLLPIQNDSGSVRFERLAIQPTIMSSRPVELLDLGIATPIAPASSKAPVPPRTNGAMLAVGAALAGMLAPQVYLPTVPACEAASLVILLVLGALVMRSTNIFNYGLWLRRGGLTTAARSNVPAGVSGSLLSIATSLNLGYVIALNGHSPC